MLIPSGILCNVIAIVSFIPKLILVLVDIKVAIPSGILCIIIEIMDIIPTLYNKSFEFGIESFINNDIIIPILIEIKIINNNGIILIVLFNKLYVCGIKSNSDIKSITDEENDSDFIIILLFLIYIEK